MWMSQRLQSAQHCFVSTIEKLKKNSLDSSGISGLLLTDLFKAFECIDHELLIAKLYTYSSHKNPLFFIHSYLRQRKQRTKINTSFSIFADILYGVPQGSILGKLLFDIYIHNLFYDTDHLDVANYADHNNTPYACSSSYYFGETSEGY